MRGLLLLQSQGLCDTLQFPCPSAFCRIVERCQWVCVASTGLDFSRILATCGYLDSLLGYKNPVRTSQETHYVSAMETCRLMVRKIRSFHGGDYDECHLL
jgi:hypothetical protein